MWTRRNCSRRLRGADPPRPRAIASYPPHLHPIQDAIDFAEFLAYSAVMFSRFAPGSPGVGGPIEIAAITKHEGFKWVKRKHYFNSELNLDILR